MVLVRDVVDVRTCNEHSLSIANGEAFGKAPKKSSHPTLPIVSTRPSPKRRIHFVRKKSRLGFQSITNDDLKYQKGADDSPSRFYRQQSCHVLSRLSLGRLWIDFEETVFASAGVGCSSDGIRMLADIKTPRGKRLRIPFTSYQCHCMWVASVTAEETLDRFQICLLHRLNVMSSEGECVFAGRPMLVHRPSTECKLMRVCQYQEGTLVRGLQLHFGEDSTRIRLAFSFSDTSLDGGNKFITIHKYLLPD